MLNVGIVGLGHVAKHQISAIRMSDDFHLVAGCDTDPANLALLDPALDSYTDIEAMLEHPNLDVVVVATPNKLHVEHGFQVMEAGKWLLIEKPVAETQEMFQIISDAKSRFGGHCTVALHAAFGVEVEWFFSEIQNGAFDQYQFNSFSSKFYDPYIDNGKLQDAARSLGGSWMDSGINLLSVICRFIDPDNIKMIDSQLTRDEKIHCLEVQGSVNFDVTSQFLNGSGSADTDWRLGLDKKSTAFGIGHSDRKLVLDHSEQTVFFADRDEKQVLFSCENNLPRLTNHYVGVFDDLARQVRLGNDNIDYCRKLHDILYQAENWAL